MDEASRASVDTDVIDAPLYAEEHQIARLQCISGDRRGGLELRSGGAGDGEPFGSVREQHETAAIERLGAGATVPVGPSDARLRRR